MSRRATAETQTKAGMAAPARTKPFELTVARDAEQANMRAHLARGRGESQRASRTADAGIAKVICDRSEVVVSIARATGRRCRPSYPGFRVYD